jgi:hypothetical protein
MPSPPCAICPFCGQIATHSRARCSAPNPRSAARLPGARQGLGRQLRAAQPRHEGELPNEYPERAFSVAYALKDIGYALELVQLARVELSGARNAKALLERTAAAGHAEEYFPVIAKVI